MTICYTGDYNPNYPRHRVIIRGLRENGVTVIEAPLPRKGFSKYTQLARTILRNRHADVFFFGYSDSRVVWLARLLTFKPIFWDAFYSLYDNWVFDRKLARPGSLKANYYWFLDWISCRGATVVILDTNANIDYFRKTFHLPNKKFLRVLIGADDTVMIPRPKDPNERRFIVEFHGNYIPVHGIEYIVQAAKLLEAQTDIHFVMIGEGQEREKILALADTLKLRNMTFHPLVPYEELPAWIANADVCLGLLGDLDRSGRAIPNKVYEASAMERASINRDGPAIRELYTDGKDILYCRAGDPQDIADKILKLKNNPALRTSIARNAYALYRQHGTPQAIGAGIKSMLEKYHA